MQHKPETGEQVASETAPLSPSTNIAPFRAAHPWRGKGSHTRRWGGSVLSIVGVVLVVLALAAIVVTSPLGKGWFSSTRPASGQSSSAALSRAVGSISFASSDQGNGLAGQGTADELQIDLAGIPGPAPGDSYYGWLLPDSQSATSTPAIGIGKLAVEGGSIRVLYSDGLHRNLLALVGGFLITEEQSASLPLQPSPDQATWRFQATYPQAPGPSDGLQRFSELDHLRHLLSGSPLLASMGLRGGLDAWFARNIQKVFESAGAAQGYFGQPDALPLLRTHLAIILEYLDGARDARLDLSGLPASPAPLGAQVSLLQIDASPPGPPTFVGQIDLELKGVMAAPGNTAKLRTMAEDIDGTLTRVGGWLRQLRSDVRQLAAMSGTQLLQPQAQTLLNDADTMAQYAFIGRASPTTNAAIGGATQIHYALLRLAALQVMELPFPSTRSPDAA